MSIASRPAARRARPLAAATFALACLLVAGLLALPAGIFLADAADAGPKKDYKSEGFSWQLPDNWNFEPTSPAESKGGVVAKASCSEASVTAYIFKQESDLEVSGRVKDVIDAGPEGMGSLVRHKVMDTTLSGVSGKVVIKKVKPDGGGEGHLRTYIIKSGGAFYQLIVQAWHGAHTSEADSINGVRKGFRLAKGAGEADADETMTEVDSKGDKDSSTDGADGADGDSGSIDGVDWPANGPKREGDCVHIDNRNLRWTLPEKPLRWAGAIENVKAESGRFVWAVANAKRKKGEFEKGTPDNNFLMMDLLIQKVPAGLKADKWVQGGGAQNNVIKGWKMISEINTGKTRTKPEIKIGNHKGSYAKFEGKTQQGQHRVVMLFTTVLLGDWYVFRAIGTGHTDAYKHLAPFVGKALKGVKFLTTKEPTRGPLNIKSVPDFATKRGEAFGEEKTYTLPGLSFEKPEWMSKVPAGSSMERELRWAGEGRSEDGESYIYLDISTYQLNIPNTPNVDPEVVISKRGEAWRAGAGPNARLTEKGKGPTFKKGRFGSAKGLVYEFHGSLNEVPFIEQGWVVKHKSTLIRFRVQYGGVDAEKKMKKHFKEIRKGVNFKK